MGIGFVRLNVSDVHSQDRPCRFRRAAGSRNGAGLGLRACAGARRGITDLIPRLLLREGPRDAHHAQPASSRKGDLRSVDDQLNLVIAFRETFSHVSIQNCEILHSLRINSRGDLVQFLKRHHEVHLIDLPCI